MKNLFKSMMAIAVAAMSFTACSNDLTEDVTPSQEFTVQINAVENLSRTHFGDLNEGKYPTLWDATDKVKASLNMTTAKNSTETTIAVDGTTASFKLSLNESTAPYTIYAISPANVASSISSEYSNWTITIPDSQEPDATTCDPAAQVVVGQTEALDILPSSVDMKFEHLTAYAKINFTNVTPLGDAVVNSITITADQYIAGKHYYQVADNGSYTAGQLRSAGGAVKSITITTSELNNVWVALAPTTVSELTFTINTDKGSITKEVTGLNKEFRSGVVATFNVNMDGIELAGPDETATGTIDFRSTNQRVSQDGNSQVWRNENVTLTNNKASSSNAVVGYSNPVRFYQGSSLEIDAPGSITKIVFDCNSNSYATELKNSISSGATVTVSSDVVTVEPSASANSFVVAKLAAQVRMDSLTVTYVPLDTDAPYISLSQSSVSADADATSVEISWTLTNLTVEDVAITSSADWVTFDAANDKLTINIADNTARDACEATVTLNAEGLDEIQISVKQLGIETLDEVTIAQFLEKSTSDTAWYKLTGTISDITNTTFGNFNITDETGTVYVYGLTKTQVSSNDKSFASIGLKEGDIVTLIGTRAEHDSSAQVGGPAYYVSHIASCVAPTITCEENVVTITAEKGATIYYTIDGTEPSTSSQVYSAPFDITKDCVVKAFAIADGKAKSVVSEKTCVYADPNAGTSKKSYTFTITTSDFNGTSYAANNNEKTSIATAGDGSTLEVKWTSNQVMYQNSAIQWQKSKGYIYNSTDLGTITNIDIDSTAGSFTTYTNSTVQPTSNGVGGYFKISVGSATGKVNSITITFEK